MPLVDVAEDGGDCYPGDAYFEALRKSEFRRLDEQGHAYLDYTAGNLYPESLIEKQFEKLRHSVLGNPHSKNPSSDASSLTVHEARQKVRDFLGDAAAQYEVIFTFNASHSLKLVAESYPFCANTLFAYTQDNHNSVLGLRDFALKNGSSLFRWKLEPDFTLDPAKVPALQTGQKGLLAFPAQSNSTGIKHDLRFVHHFQQLGWDVLLDGAAFVSSSPLNLSEVQPDFLVFSFYKMFGYPTGLGALLVNRKGRNGQPSALEKLVSRKACIAGGTVDMISSSDVELVSSQTRNALLYRDYRAFEEGTPSYLDMQAISAGIDFLQDVGMENIRIHNQHMMSRLCLEVSQFAYPNGAPFALIAGGAERTDRGGNILIKFLHPSGKQIWCGTLEERLRRYNADPAHKKLSFRIGTFCNPGVDECFTGTTDAEISERFRLKLEKAVSKHSGGQWSPEMEADAHRNFENALGRMPGGARISVGLATVQADVDAFLDFCRFLLKETSEMP